ncbi:MAG: glycosyltransferase [Anaerolineae bacterium]|nr:glycosyltransferase [Anaerolineae bacterium]
MALALAGQGDAAYTAWLRAEVARLGIGAHVTWPGFLEGAAKWRALAAADVALLPSYSESFGVAAVEAMACATPVIVSDQVALSAEVREAGAGVATPCRVQPLRDAIVTLATDPARRQAMGAAGRRLYARRFTVAQAAQAMLRCYERIV